MKFAALALIATAYAQDAETEEAGPVDPCACVGVEGLPDGTFFTDAGYPENYGSECTAWDLEDPQCAEDGAYFGEAWCTEAWCYTSVECETAIPTIFFAETEYKDTLAFSVDACAATEEGSSALFVSAFAAVAAIAATI